MSISSIFTSSSGLLLRAAESRGTSVIRPAGPSTAAAKQVTTLESGAAAILSARNAIRSARLEDLSGLVAEAEVRARTIELFGDGDGSNESSAMSPGGWVASKAEADPADWFTPGSSSSSWLAESEPETGATDALNASLLADPADENGDGFVSLTEELTYALTNLLDSRSFTLESPS